MLYNFIKVSSFTIENKDKRPSEFRYELAKEEILYKTIAFWPAESGSYFRVLDTAYAINENTIAYLAKSGEQWLLLNTWDRKSWENSWIPIPKN